MLLMQFVPVTERCIVRLQKKDIKIHCPGNEYYKCKNVAECRANDVKKEREKKKREKKAQTKRFGVNICTLIVENVICSLATDLLANFVIGFPSVLNCAGCEVKQMQTKNSYLSWMSMDVYTL